MVLDGGVEISFSAIHIDLAFHPLVEESLANSLAAGFAPQRSGFRAIGHFSTKGSLCARVATVLGFSRFMEFSEYVRRLPADARARYAQKVTKAGLTRDPYLIHEWEATPEVIAAISISDLMLYMVSTPSPYTKEEVKVSGV